VFALRGAGFERTIPEAEDPEDDPAVYLRAVGVLGRMVHLDKYDLLDGCTTPEEVFASIEEDYSSNSAENRSLLLRQIENTKFEGVGKMKPFLDGIEQLVRRYKVAGGDYTDENLISMLKAKLPKDYDAMSAIIGFTLITFAQVKSALLQWDMTLVQRKQEEALSAKMEVMQVERKPWAGNRREQPTCYNCGSKGHKSFECKAPKKVFKCYNCGGEGHKSFECPAQKKKESENCSKCNCNKSVNNKARFDS